jgi:putative ABC transport system permease protein
MQDWKHYVKERVPRINLPAAREAEILEELAELLEDAYEDALKSGATEQEALAMAMSQLPDGAALAKRIEQAEAPAASRISAPLHIDRMEDRLIRSQKGAGMSNFFHDVKYAIRMLMKHPGYTALAVIALALGCGANTAIFSMAYALLEKPVAVPDPRGLFIVEEYRLDNPFFDGLSYPAYTDLKGQSETLIEWAASRFYDTNVAGEGTPERVLGAQVTANFFDVLKARPLHGRVFLRDEETPGRGRVTVLGYGLFERRFGGDASILGKVIRLEGQPFEVVGVMPPEFGYPVAAELWMPLDLTPERRMDRTSRSLTAVAHLAPDATEERAVAEMEMIGERMAQAHPDESRGWAARVMSIREEISGNGTRDYMTLLLGAVSFVLLIAIANVANLQLARATGRYREVAVRVALGAGRWRLIRQLMTESILQSLLAVAVGMVFAWWSLELIRSNFPPDVLRFVPGINVMSLDWPTFIFSFAIAVVAGSLAGLAPALQFSRPNLNDTLRDGGRGLSGGRGRHLTRNSLVVAEVALALVLLVGAGLMVQGSIAIRMRHDSIEPDRLLTFGVNLPNAGYTPVQARVSFYDRVLERIRAVPGVESVALGRSVPFANNSSGGEFSIEGRVLKEGEALNAQFQHVNTEWFQTLRIPLKRGRLPEYADGLEAPPVAVISEGLARRYFPGEDPLGKRVKFGGVNSESAWRTVVGVAGDISYNWFDRSPEPVIYASYRQTAAQLMQLAVRTKADPQSLTPAIRREVAAVDADMPVYEVKTHAKVIHESVIGLTYVSTMMLVMGVIALVLASVGLYGVMAYAVTERTHEIGVRMALGAETRDVLRLMLARGITLTGIGLALGLVLSVALARLLSGLVYGVSATDFATFGGVIVLLACVALAATYIPARRACLVDPLTTLRHD